MSTSSRLGALLLCLPLAALSACQRSEASAVKAPVEHVAPVRTMRAEVAPAVRHTFSGRLPITGELKQIGRAHV